VTGDPIRFALGHRGDPQRPPRLKFSLPSSPMTRSAYLQRTYGISESEYNDLLIYQEGRCAICRELPREGENLAVDHNHRTGSNRGLLCQRRCNKLLGFAQDSREALLRAIAYLDEYDGCPHSEQLGEGSSSVSEQVLKGTES
jgi:hypothetical protein